MKNGTEKMQCANASVKFVHPVMSGKVKSINVKTSTSVARILAHATNSVSTLLDLSSVIVNLVTLKINLQAALILMNVPRHLPTAQRTPFVSTNQAITNASANLDSKSIQAMVLVLM